MVSYFFNKSNECFKLNEKQQHSINKIVIFCSEFILEHYACGVPHPEKEYIFDSISNDTACEFFEYGMRMLSNGIAPDIANLFLEYQLNKIIVLINSSVVEKYEVDVHLSCLISKQLLHYIYIRDIHSYLIVISQLCPFRFPYGRYAEGFERLGL